MSDLEFYSTSTFLSSLSFIDAESSFFTDCSKAKKGPKAFQLLGGFYCEATLRNVFAAEVCSALLSVLLFNKKWICTAKI